mgnify:CR=1 FL=1
MSDYISRRSVMELVQFMPAKGGPIGMVPTKAVLRIPAADVRPVVRGKWGKDGDCPVCGCQPWYERDIHTLNFCPNCGADMRED